jgi:RNA polymerase sigma-70 factor (ECF subfamily)
MHSESLEPTPSTHALAQRIRAESVEYRHGLYNYALSLTRSRPEAEDLVQETFLRAMPAMERLPPDSNVRAWLFTILRNAWFNELRKQRNSPEIVEFENELLDNLPGSSKDSSEKYESKMEAEKLRSAIQKLSPKLREIILFREYDELSCKKIATILNCPIGTVMSRSSRARTKLRTILQCPSRIL